MREYRYVIYAERFGWTPEQVDSLPLAVEPWILPIHNAIDEERNRRADAAHKVATRKSESLAGKRPAGGYTGGMST